MKLRQTQSVVISWKSRSCPWGFRKFGNKEYLPMFQKNLNQPKNNGVL